MKTNERDCIDGKGFKVITVQRTQPGPPNIDQPITGHVYNKGVLPDLQGNVKSRKKIRELRITNALGVALVCCAY